MADTAEAVLETVDIMQLMRLLPHRYPFLLVDRIVAIDQDNSAIGIKNVTVNEPHFQGHFPEQPVMPGVLIIEAMAQTAGAICVRSTAVGQADAGLFHDHRQCQVPPPGGAGRPPGDPCPKLKKRGNIWRFACEALVDGAKAAEAEISAMMSPKQPG